MNECIHGEELQWCPRCKTSTYRGAHWDAMYASSCSECPIRIEVGDRIRWSDDGTNVQHSRHK